MGEKNQTKSDTKRRRKVLVEGSSIQLQESCGVNLMLSSVGQGTSPS